MERGLFIVFEGIDGSGKSSCMGAVASEVKKTRETVMTAEPTEGEIGMLIRSSPDLTAEAEAMLFTADRAIHTNEIKEWVAAGKTVLCDRYYASTIAYQSADLNGRSADADWLKEMNDKVTIEPDLTLLFDIDPEKGMVRVESRGEKSKFERVEYLKEVRANYLKIAKERNFKVIDASGPKDKVFEDVMKHVKKVMS